MTDAYSVILLDGPYTTVAVFELQDWWDWLNSESGRPNDSMPSREIPVASGMVAPSPQDEATALVTVGSFTNDKAQHIGGLTPSSSGTPWFVKLDIEDPPWDEVEDDDDNGPWEASARKAIAEWAKVNDRNLPDTNVYVGLWY